MAVLWDWWVGGSFDGVVHVGGYQIFLVRCEKHIEYCSIYRHYLVYPDHHIVYLHASNRSVPSV